jgi:CheY-like chemotaxis protein
MAGTPILNVLVVDDEPHNCEIAELILTTLGHRVSVCVDGGEALRCWVAAEAPFDLVLMDVLMPVMSGLEAIRQLRALPWGPQAAVICVSARTSDKDVEAGYAAGADHYLKKPFRRSELLAAIDQTLLQRAQAAASPGL